MPQEVRLIEAPDKGLPGPDVSPPPAEKIAAVDRAVAGEVGIVFQPLVDIRARKILGYEALARPKSPHFQGPLDLFRTAAALGKVGALGRAFRALASTHCPQWPLFLNVFPNEFDEAYLVKTDDPIFRHRSPVYLEIVESVPLSHFEQCRGVLAEIRARGVLLAVDDLGAGYSNLKYIEELSPQIVKLDRELVKGVRHDSRQFRLLRSIIRLCQDMDAKVVVEGVETVGELAAAQEAGADYCQGYFLARPDFPPPAVDRASYL
jgi:EAL domain-containing protein (putative c-di-GMP-specific phosphodiesterase class I)